MSSSVGNKLTEFLQNYSVSKDAEYTHTSLVGGKYLIPANKADEFHKLYAQQVFEKGKTVSLTEKHPERFSKICIDLDLRYSDRKERSYTIALIKDLVVTYQDFIREVLGNELSEQEALAFVFEKEGPEFDEEKNILKDGIHIMFPYLCISYRAQHWVRQKVVQKMNEHPELVICCTPVDQIIDKCVVERNNWIMYGSKKKPTSHAYELTYIFDLELDERELISDNLKLLKLLSIQHRFPEKQTVIGDILKKEEKMIISKQKNEEIIAESISINMQPVAPRKSIEYVRTLLSLLNERRVNDYEDWLRIGAILHNESEENLDLWKQWSSQSPKYDERVCDKLWNQTFANYAEERRVRIGSLQKMAREDSPARYYIEMDRFISEDDLSGLIIKSLRNTHSEFAELTYHLLKDKYCFSKELWYCFENNKWTAHTSPIRLLQDISLIVRNVLYRYSSMLSTKIADEESKRGEPIPETDPIKVRKDQCEKSIKLLKNSSYKTAIVKESQEFFYDENFYKELDMNIYLLGFNNGVYDLKNGIFRDTRPEDKISMTTGYDYTEEIIPEIREYVLDIFDKSLPDKNVREFLLTFLASTCIGRNKNELFVNLEGSGGNGKGVIKDLHDHTLGDYAGTLNNSYLTNVSNSQEGHNSLLISVFKKRFVCVNEPPKGKTLNQDFIKELTGNDKLQVRKAHAPEPELSDVPMFKLVMLFNKIPKIEDAQDGGFLRRMKGINFPNRFVNYEPTKPNEFRADPNIKIKLKDDMRYRQQFMIILLEYVRRYIENDEKIQVPELVDMNTKSILQSQDFYAEFVDMCLEITGNESDTMTCKELLEEYQCYYREYISVGSKPPSITMTDFTERMKRCFSAMNVEYRANIKVGGERRGKGFVGVRILEQNS